MPYGTVWKAIDRFKKTGSNEDRKGRGRKNVVNTTRNQKKINTQLKKNPRLSTRKLAKITQISRRSIQRIIKNKLGLKSYKLQEGHLLTNKIKETMFERCKKLKQRFGGSKHRLILFSDEKLFTIEQCHNRQNDRIWSDVAPTNEDRIVSRSQKPKSVMVWAGITSNGKTPLLFIEDGVKINQVTYRALLQDKVLPWANDHFGDEAWTFMQDSAPSHKAKLTQD